MPATDVQESQNPLILRCHRLMEAFAKSDDERDFFIDRYEGFLIYVDLDKPQEELDLLNKELTKHAERYCSIPKLSFYEIKKIMEGFVNEKVYDIDTKEKLLDIIQSKEARDNFLEFIYDHHAEQEKWQQYYQERSRIRIIEWLRQNHFHFVFEEDLDLPRQTIEKLKQSLFQSKVGKDILNARKALVAKAKTYYSNEALNPRPKRGRPPKQAAKPEMEPQVTMDIYTTVTTPVRPFLFSPDLNLSPTFSLFSSKFESEEDILHKRLSLSETEATLHQKLASLRTLSSRWMDNKGQQEVKEERERSPYEIDSTFDDKSFEDDEDDLDDDLLEEEGFISSSKKGVSKKAVKKEAKSSKKEAKPAKKEMRLSQKETKSSKKEAKPPRKEAKSLRKEAKPPKKASIFVAKAAKGNNGKASTKVAASPKGKRIVPDSKKGVKPLKKLIPKKKNP